MRREELLEVADGVGAVVEDGGCEGGIGTGLTSRHPNGQPGRAVTVSSPAMKSFAGLPSYPMAVEQRVA